MIEQLFEHCLAHVFDNVRNVAFSWDDPACSSPETDAANGRNVPGTRLERAVEM
jgi:hypothetical protein